RRSAVRIASLNMNGFGCTVRDHPDNKWGQVYSTMRDARIGVLLLQETHLTAERVSFIEHMFKGKIRILYSPHPTRPTQKEGVAIAINCRLVDPATVERVEVDKGRAIQVSIPWNNNSKISVLCIYAPTSDGETTRRLFFKKVEDFYASHPQLPRPSVMAGDFNNLEDTVDRLPVGSGRDSSIEALDDLKRAVGLMMVDGWRATHPTQRAYTFLRGMGGTTQMSRLDRIYTQQSLFDDCREWKIHEGGVRSDHSMVSVEVTRRDSPELGKGRPVFPKGLLKDRKLAKCIHKRGLEAIRDLELTSRTGRTVELNPQTVLASMKQDWLRMAREREREVVPRLLAEIRTREAALSALRRNTQVSDDARRVESAALTSQIRSLYAARARKQKQFSRARHTMEGERPTKYWVKVNKDARPRDTMLHLAQIGRRQPDGGATYEYSTDGMCKIAREHHMNLQNDESASLNSEQRKLDTDECLQSLGTDLSLRQASMMDSKISYNENEIALRFSKNDSAPGIDGIPYEVWKTVHARFVEDSRHEDREAFDVLLVLTAAFRDVQEHGLAKGSRFNEGWMCPIYKGKGEKAEIVNYRPITLLNTDYKLMTKVLAIRL
ncbi:Endonuclease/exonuclease/phosphatase, partial [Daedaleopsis nitida]